MSALDLIRAMPSIGLESVAEGEESVYFVEQAGLVKVGFSGNPRLRLRGLINSAGAPLRILAVAPGSWFRERHLHNLLSESRHHSEWFHPTFELVAWIEAARAASMEWRSLPNGAERRYGFSGPVVLTEKQKKARAPFLEAIEWLNRAEEVANKAQADFLAANGRDADGFALGENARATGKRRGAA